MKLIHRAVFGLAVTSTILSLGAVYGVLTKKPPPEDFSVKDYIKQGIYMNKLPVLPELWCDPDSIGERGTISQYKAQKILEDGGSLSGYEILIEEDARFSLDQLWNARFIENFGASVEMLSFKKGGVLVCNDFGGWKVKRNYFNQILGVD